MNDTVSIFTSKMTPGADICVGLAILFIVLLSLMGNGLVLVISYRRRKQMIGSEMLCVNLAVVDFLCCLCFHPLSILSSFNHAWLGRNTTCVYYGLGCFIFGLCGMFNIAAISIFRYLKTCYSLVYGANIRIVCGALWVIATVWSSLPLLGWGEYVPEPYGLSCTIAWRAYHSSRKDAVYVICTFACFTLIPVLLIVVSQCLILRKVYRFSYSLSARGVRNNWRYTEKRLSTMFFCVSLGFITAWAPYAVVSFLFIFSKNNWNMAPEGFVLPSLFAKSSHIYNPFIYFYFNKAFQRELRILFHSLCPWWVTNRVGVHRQAPNPVQIQLEERDCTQHRTSCNGKHSMSRLPPGGFVYTCWGSTPKMTPTTLNPVIDELLTAP